MRRLTTWLSAAAVLLAAGVAGCGPTKKTPDKPNGAKTNGDDHADHPLHGPNGGHVAELASAAAKGKEDYHAEWLHDDESGLVTVFLLDAKLKEIGIDAEVLTIDVKAGDKSEQYLLKAANRTDGDMPTATRFELTNQKLATILAADVIDAVILVKIKDEEYSGKIVQHKH